MSEPQPEPTPTPTLAPAPEPEPTTSPNEPTTEPHPPSEPPTDTPPEPETTPPPEPETNPPPEPITESPSKEKRSFIQPAVSFKVESNLFIDLSDHQRKSLTELKTLISTAISTSTLLPTTAATTSTTTTTTPSIWGIPLLEDDRSDVILLKFLRARDFKPIEALAMLKSTLTWRTSFDIETLLQDDLGDDLDKVVFMHGHDRDGHPVCYNVYGEFQNKELYVKTFSSEEKRGRFLRWRIRFLEKSIRELDFTAGGVNTIFQVNDLKNAPGPGKRELRLATRQALGLLQDNYPEFVAKQVFINVPWYYVAFYTMMSPFMTQRTKSKFVFASPSKTAETLFKYISPEQVPIQYGGLSVDYCDCNPEFTVDDTATIINLKPTTKQFVEIICSETCVIVWELRVVGWEVTYSAEFSPNAETGYTVIIQKATKMAANDDPVISGSFKVSDLGRIILTVDNPTFKKKRLLYRYKVLPLSD
ncbi:patellin-3 [Silene latifolia]|uniref:patellin-3 n=1 Tax=Silene latifolia TaxID=37657 RepID=UPI003D76CC59